MNTERVFDGLERLEDRRERRMVWRWKSKGGFSYEVIAESARLRQVAREERERAKNFRLEKKVRRLARPHA